MRARFILATLVSIFVMTGFVFPTLAAPRSIGDRLSVVAEHEFTDPRIAQLPDRTKKLLSHLLEAAVVMDSIYLDQTHPMNLYWLNTLRTWEQEGRSSAKQYARYFDISYGPWDVFTEEWIFPKDLFPEASKLAGYNLYPTREKNGKLESVTKEELDKWVTAHPKDEEALKSPYTVVRYNADKTGFIAIPYSEYYREPLEAAASHLEKAIPYADERKVKSLLSSRAKAFRTNTYNDTEEFWIKTHDAEIQLLIGPYEESVDEIWGVKRGFGARVGLKDPEGTADLQSYKALGDEFQKNLPIDPKFHPDTPKQPFFTVWRQIYTSGDSRKGAQTLGQKLPNDNAIAIQFGARQSFYRNSQDGKCQKILMPISKVVLAKDIQPQVTCDSFFKSTLHHEYAHALGIPFWYPDWSKPTPDSRKEVNANLPKWGGKLEELKADTLGNYNRLYMLDKGLEKAKAGSQELKKELFASMVAGFFRSVQFGLHRSYALNAMIMLNQMLDAGAVKFDPKQDGRVTLVPEKLPNVIRDLAQKSLMLQVENNDEKVGEYYKKYAVIRPDTQRLLDRMGAAGIPRDLIPVFPALKQLSVLK